MTARSRGAEARLTLSFDMRAPAFGAPVDALYRAALEQASWADDVGFDALIVNEHHGSADGYLPAPLVFAAALAARTSRIRIWISALVLPLHDPIAAAEELAVLDLVSGGRLTLAVAAGYRHAEFEMFGADFQRRVRSADEALQVLLQAWTGEPFDYRGRTVTVRPRPLQQPRIPIVIGGSSPGSARRAARLADGYRPTRPELVDVYRDELRRLGRPEPLIAPTLAGEPAVFVSRDPESGWARIAPHAVHDTNSYAQWTRDQVAGSRHTAEAAAETVRTRGNYLVLTPDQCVERIAAGHGLHLKPLLAGLDPEVAWQSLRLIESDVLPRARSVQSGFGIGGWVGGR
jgi:alkanesulfonate monooxygenase SsuD/methylene tetrahydromethanopterin reductase-like flavin-dependent oxidoreductase (luciferase family)